MEKDRQIAAEFRAYIEGTQEPHVDLTAAKRALEEGRRQRRRRRNVLYAVASAAACAVFALVLLIALLPSSLDKTPADPGGPARYSYAAARAEETDFPTLRELYGAQVSPFEPFSYAPNMQAFYTLYTPEGSEGATLLVAELGYLQGGTLMRATVYVDLTAGEYEAEELVEYRELAQSGYRYDYEVSPAENGEYVGRAHFSYYGNECCVSVQSSDRSAIHTIVEILI